jgi:hypothetical protein
MPPINKKRKFEELKEEEEDSSDDESVMQGGQTGSEAGDASSLGPANIIRFCKVRRIHYC